MTSWQRAYPYGKSAKLCGSARRPNPWLPPRNTHSANAGQRCKAQLFTPSPERAWKAIGQGHAVVDAGLGMGRADRPIAAGPAVFVLACRGALANRQWFISRTWLHNSRIWF